MVFPPVASAMVRLSGIRRPTSVTLLTLGI
jgi:hypothetical protein